MCFRILHVYLTLYTIRSYISYVHLNYLMNIGKHLTVQYNAFINGRRVSFADYKLPSEPFIPFNSLGVYRAQMGILIGGTIRMTFEDNSS